MKTDANSSDKVDIQWAYWPAVLGTALVAATMPWYLGAIDSDVRLPLRVLLGGGVLAALSMQWSTPSSKLIGHAAPYFLGVVVLDAVWFGLGTVNAPGFLVLFAIPVFAAALVSRGWLEVCVAAFAVVCTATTAAISSQELRWYAGQLGLVPSAWVRWQPTPLDTLRFETSASGPQQLTMLGTFALALLGVSLFGSTAARAVTRLVGSLADATRAQRESDELVARMLEQNTTPQCLVAQETGEIITANVTFESRFPPVDGTTIGARLRPEYPEDFRRLLDSDVGGAVAGAACRPRDGFALLDFTVKANATDDAPTRLVSVLDTTPEALTAIAVAEMGVGVAVLSPNGRVLASNPVFLGTFPDAVVGAYAQNVLAGCSRLEGDWWQIAPHRRLQLHSERGGRVFSVTVVVAGANPDTALTVLWMEQLDV